MGFLLGLPGVPLLSMQRVALARKVSLVLGQLTRKRWSADATQARLPSAGRAGDAHSQLCALEAVGVGHGGDALVWEVGGMDVAVGWGRLARLEVERGGGGEHGQEGEGEEHVGWVGGC